MISYKFKTFETIAKLKKLYEADENVEQGEQEPAPEGEVAPEEQAQADAQAPVDDQANPEETPPVDATAVQAEDPAAQENTPNEVEQQADPEAGEFISDNQKAMFAKMLLDALMAQPPSPGTIPKQWMNATTDNADEIIKYVQELNALESSLSLDNESDPKSIAGALKDL